MSLQHETVVEFGDSVIACPLKHLSSWEEEAAWNEKR
jgi:hypothetical protein